MNSKPSDLSHELVRALILEIGTLSGLLSLFKTKGLNEIVDSWVLPGPNLPISAEQLRHVLGQRRIYEMARRHSLPQDTWIDHVAERLPRLIDNLTPLGQVPNSSSITRQLSNSFR